MIPSYGGKIGSQPPVSWKINYLNLFIMPCIRFVHQVFYRFTLLIKSIHYIHGFEWKTKNEGELPEMLM